MSNTTQADGRTKQAAKKGFETSTLLALAGGVAVPALATIDPGTDWQSVFSQANAGNWLTVCAALLPVALSRIPWLLRVNGWTRTAGAFEAARAPDSPGGEDVTVGEIVGIGEAARDDWGALDKRGSQRGEDD